MSASKQVAGAPARYLKGRPWLEGATLLAVTNGAFELRARTLARQLGVRLVDRSEVLALRSTAAGMVGLSRAA